MKHLIVSLIAVLILAACTPKEAVLSKPTDICQYTKEKLSEEGDISLFDGQAVNGVVCEYYKSGELKNEMPYQAGKAEGIGKGYYESGNLEWEAFYQDGKLESLAQVYYESGAIKQEILYQNDKIEGIGKAYYESGKLDCEHQEDGINRCYYESSELRREIPLEAGKREGLGRDFYKNGIVQLEVLYENDKAEGVAKEYYKSGKLECMTPFKNDQKEGLAQCYYEAAENQQELILKTETPYKAGKREGLIKHFYENGIMELEVLYENDKAEGVGKRYYEGGSLELEMPVKNNRREGVTKEYFESGELSWEVPFKNGTPDGTIKAYRPDGSLQQEMSAQAGSLKTYYSNGQLQLEMSIGIKPNVTNFPYRKERLSLADANASLFAWQVPHGIARQYWSDGRLNKEISYKNGAKDGLLKDYMTDWGGKAGDEYLYYDESYSNGKIDGLRREYYKSGALRDETSYHNGELYGAVKYYYESGSLWREVPMANWFMISGLVKSYYESGVLEDETSYKGGEPTGAYKFYYEDGKLGQETADNGSSTYYDEEGNLRPETWIDAYMNFVRNYGDYYAIEALTLLDVDLDEVPELFFTDSWFENGFSYKNGEIVPIKVSEIYIGNGNLGLYKNNKTGELEWLESNEGEWCDNDFGNYDEEFGDHDEEIACTYTYNLYKIDFSDFASVKKSTFLSWEGRFTRRYNADGEEIAESAKTYVLIDNHNGKEKVTTKAKLIRLKDDLFANYTQVESKRCVADIWDIAPRDLWKDGDRRPQPSRKLFSAFLAECERE